MTKQPSLQLALDMPDLSQALSVLQQTHDEIDIIEVGTLLCLSEGLNALRTIRAAYPEHTVVGDVRIVRAGGKIARMAFDAGADWVTVVAEAPESTLKAACAVAAESGGEVQVELGEFVDDSQVELWRSLGVEQLIYHSETEVSETGHTQWPEESLAVVRWLCDLGFRVTATGGIKTETLPMFSGIPLSIIIAGRAIWNADDPATAARALQEVIQQTYG